MIPTPNAHRDARLRNGKPLRRSEEVIHLSLDPLHPTLERDYIHEAQVSIMVIGIDDWFWTAYCFADIYFKGEEHTEQVHVMHRNNADPHSCGKYFLDRPIWNPRHYFLRSLSCRMEQVKQEWYNTIFQLFEDIEPCVSIRVLKTILAFEANLNKIYAFTRGELGQGGSIDLDITQRKGFRWTIRVLRQFTHVLSKTIDSWDTFKDGEIRYLNLPDSESLADASWGNLLAAIDKDVIELRDLRSSLQHKTELFENMTNSVSSHVPLAVHDRDRNQLFHKSSTLMCPLDRDTCGTCRNYHNQTSESVHSSSDRHHNCKHSLRRPSAAVSRPKATRAAEYANTFQFYLPPTLASSIFSMQDSIFTDPKFRDWLFTLIGLFMATALLVLAVLAFNHPRIATWLARVWASVFRFTARILPALQSIKRKMLRDRPLDPNANGIDLDNLDDQDTTAPGIGQV